MANPQLLQYIKDAKAKNLSDEAIGKALGEAGWNAADVQTAFFAIANPNAPIAEPAPAAAPAPDLSPADFVAEMERRRKAAEASKPAEYVLPNGARLTPAPASATTEKGLIGMLIKMGVAKNKQQANIILIATLVVVVGLVIWVNWR